MLKFITFYTDVLLLTKVHCAKFYQSAKWHEQLEIVTPWNRRPFSRGFQ